NERQTKNESYRSYINYWKKGLNSKILDWVTAQADSESWSFNKLVYNTKAYRKHLDQANILKAARKGSEYLRYAGNAKPNQSAPRKPAGYNYAPVPKTIIEAARQNYTSPMPIEIGNVNKSIPRRGERISDAERERRRRDKLCFRCGDSKHMARDCLSGRPYQGKVQAVEVEDRVTEIQESKEEAT